MNRFIDFLSPHWRLAISILLACIFLCLAAILWPIWCPIEMKLAGFEPAGILNGTDVWLVTLTVSNRCGQWLSFSEQGTAGALRFL
jgi:hypothetical protein